MQAQHSLHIYLDVLYFKYILPSTYVHPIIHTRSNTCCCDIPGFRGLRNRRGGNGFIWHKHGGHDNDYDLDVCLFST